MKKMFFLPVMVALLSMTSCNQKEVKNDDDAFASFAEQFGDTTSFAFAEVSGRKVLLVSHETFGNNVNSDKEAIAASVFALDSKGKILSLGSIRSQGTRYPVTLLDGKLAVAGHQFVRVYDITGDVPELEIVSADEGDGPEMDPKFEAFSKGSSIKFYKKLVK